MTGYRDLEWMESALCRQTDPEIFHPALGRSAAPAKKICRGCEVKTPCLEYALTMGELHGVYGGLTERERRTFKGSQRGPFPCPHCDESFVSPYKRGSHIGRQHKGTAA